MNFQNSHLPSIKLFLVPVLVGLSSFGVFVYFCTHGFAEQKRLTRVITQNAFEFGDVVDEAALRLHINSSEAQWADYDNDGLLDVALCCESQEPRLYQNLGNGQLADKSIKAGIVCPQGALSKACFWFDYNNDRFQDLFISYTDGNAHFFNNNGDGTFSNVTSSLASPLLNQFTKQIPAPATAL